jgi:hypothetical protein
MRTILASSALALLGVGSLPAPPPARPPQITVLPGALISADDPTHQHVESWLAMNPRDPLNLIAASMVLGEHDWVAAYASRDGGKTWIRATRGAAAGKYFDGQDPAVAFDADGNAYLSTAADAFGVWKSTDGGRTWGEPAVVPGAAYDRTFVACDRSPHGGFRGRLYAVGKMPITVFGRPGRDVIAFSISRDGGASFAFPRFLLPAPDKDLLNIVSDLQVTPDGRVILALEIVDVQPLNKPLLSGRYSIVTSDDGGRTFSEPRQVAVFHKYGHAREAQSVKGLGAAQLALDTSPGPRHGTLYAVWLDAGDGSYQVMTAASSDGGGSWSKPVRVNDNEGASNQSNPAIAVDGEGVVGVSWNDRRADPTDLCYQPYFAASADGGASFSPNVEVSQDLTCPAGSHAEGTPLDSDYRYLNGGDTQGIVGLPQGGFHLAWISGSGGVQMQLWSTIVAVAQQAPQPARSPQSPHSLQPGRP